MCTGVKFGDLSDQKGCVAYGWDNVKNGCYNYVYGDVAYPRVYGVEWGRICTKENVRPDASGPSLRVNTKVR